MANDSFNFNRLSGNGNANKLIAGTSELVSKKKKELVDIANETLSKVIEIITGNHENHNDLQKKFVLDETHRIINEILFESKRNLSFGDKQKIANYVMDEVFGYGPITSLIDDPTITEIMVNSPEDVYIERKGKIIKVENNFRDYNHIMHTIDKIISPLGEGLMKVHPW